MGKKGGELGSLVNNHSLKRMDQAFIQIKYINVHRINLIDLRKYNTVQRRILYINYNEFKTPSLNLLKIMQSIRFQMFK